MIMAKNSNNNYVNIEDIEAKNNNEYYDIEKIVSKQGNLLYNKYKETEGTLPINFKGKGKDLADYRIYGQTVDGESVGDRTANLFDEEYGNIPENLPIYEAIYVGDGYFTLSTTAPLNANSAASLFLMSGNVQTGASTNTTGVWSGHNITVESVNGYITVAYRYQYGVDPRDYNTMLNFGSTALPYEPYGYKVLVTVSNGTDAQTIPIYLSEQIRKIGDEAEYISYSEQKQYIESTDGRGKYVVGLNVDFENKTFTRLANAVGLEKGSDFDNFSAFGGRKRCNVLDDGTITAYYGDSNYVEDGSNGQVMVYQPAFYYKVKPIKIEAQDTGIGYHLRNVNYYISNYKGEGFKLHPAFYNEAGEPVDYVLLGAYEGCLYDSSENSYITDDSQVMEVSEDKFSSIADVKPASGSTQRLTRPNVETLAQNRGNGWHSSTVKVASMNQLLCMIEMGTMNFQTAIGQGVVSYTLGAGNEASNTGATSSLGNATGQATQTKHISSDGVETIDTTAGKLSVSYRGLENPWGNIWEFENGVNIWGNGNMAGGEPYIANDFNFAESKNTENYEGAGFTVSNTRGFISAMGYSTKCDWLFMGSECLGSYARPVGDYLYVVPNLNGYRTSLLGAQWNGGTGAGGFYWNLYYSSECSWDVGGRLVYVPQIKKQHIYTTDIDVTLPALPTLTGTNVLSVGTEVQPSSVYLKGKLKRTIYGWHVDPDISDSSNAITYLKDAIGMIPASMGSSTFNYGSWQNAFFMPKPCMLKSNGKVDYYLDPNDYTKKLDGTTSDISNPNYDGNAMMQWPKIWFKYIKGVKEGQGYFYVANYKADGNYHCWCNYDSEDNEIDHFYTAIYNGTSFMDYKASKTYVVNDFAVYDNKLYKCNTAITTAQAFDSAKWNVVSNTAPAINKMRSLSGIRLTNNNGNAQTDTTTEVTRAEANNTTAAKEWYIETFSDRLLINGLLVLMGKSLNTQAVFGRGLDTGGQSAKEAYVTGTLNNKGLFWGVTENGNSGVKVFGMENFWGCCWHRTTGLITNNRAVKLKLTYGTKDGSTVIGYNQTGNGYIDNGTAPYPNGYVRKMSYNKYGFMPAVVTGGSQSTYYADYHYQNANHTETKYALFGGNSGDVLRTGAFYLHLNNAPRDTDWYVAASLSCKPLLN